jgi:hypothetical protein
MQSRPRKEVAVAAHRSPSQPQLEPTLSDTSRSPGVSLSPVQSLHRGQSIRVDLGDLGPPPLLVPTNLIEVHAEARDALSTWLGATYPEDDLDTLMSMLGTWAWLPGTKAALMKRCGLPLEALVRLI